MRQYRNNIDPVDAAASSSYPFAEDADMQLGSAELPTTYVRAIRLYCRPGLTLPAYINGARVSRMSSGQDMCILQFSDAYGTLIGTASMVLLSDAQWTTGPILTPEGALAGYICYNELLPTTVFRAAKFSNGTAQASIKLAPGCCVPWLQGKVRNVRINGVSTGCDVDIRPGAYVHSETSGDALAYSVVGKYQDSSDGHNGIEWLLMRKYVNGNLYTAAPVYVGGKHLIIKHSKLSNARVVCTDMTIQLKGVKDE